MKTWEYKIISSKDVPKEGVFKGASRSALEAHLNELGRAGSGRTLAISSGGLAAMVVGHLLDLSDERVIDLNLLLRNCATTEFLVSRARRNLLCFNSLPAEVSRIAETFV